MFIRSSKSVYDKELNEKVVHIDIFHWHWNITCIDYCYNHISQKIKKDNEIEMKEDSSVIIDVSLCTRTIATVCKFVIFYFLFLSQY